MDARQRPPWACAAPSAVTAECGKGCQQFSRAPRVFPLTHESARALVLVFLGAALSLAAASPLAPSDETTPPSATACVLLPPRLVAFFTSSPEDGTAASVESLPACVNVACRTGRGRRSVAGLTSLESCHQALAHNAGACMQVTGIVDPHPTGQGTCERRVRMPPSSTRRTLSKSAGASGVP
jgi:hypothetical protein